MCDRPTVAATRAAVELGAAGRSVRLSNPGTVYFSGKGCTKRDVAECFLAVGPGIIRALCDRLSTLQRFDGVKRGFFHQRRASKYFPGWIPAARIAFSGGRPADEISSIGLAVVIWAARLGALAFHPWPVRSAGTDHSGELRIDLGPQPGTDYAAAVTDAHELCSVLDSHGLRGWLKASGGRGIYVLLPIAPNGAFTEVRRAAIVTGGGLERHMPARVATAWWKERDGKEREPGDMRYPPEYPKMPGEPQRVQPGRARCVDGEGGGRSGGGGADGDGDGA
ncbi:hypothetical protein ACIOMQ_09345 [Streptomyces sp. NPDC087845]|uniref:non-homologous end-joining DNA ligase LigD n=1 Tax=Streptomyces sp. NPDC087845 TaxID=3365806 RepID=UPI0038194BA7